MPSDDGPLECPLCGTAVVFAGGVATHQDRATRCGAEGIARSAEDLGRLANAMFGAPHGAAYRDVTKSPRHQNSTGSILKAVELRRNGCPSPWVRTGEDLVVRVSYEGDDSRYYFSVFLLNDMAERVAAVHSWQSAHPPFPPSGTIECTIKDIRLGDGNYHVMVDCGIEYPVSFGVRPQPKSLDCVPNAGKVQVRLDGYLAGFGLDAYEGVAMRSSWYLREMEAYRQ